MSILSDLIERLRSIIFHSRDERELTEELELPGKTRLQCSEQAFRGRLLRPRIPPDRDASELRVLCH